PGPVLPLTEVNGRKGTLPSAGGGSSGSISTPEGSWRDVTCPKPRPSPSRAPYWHCSRFGPPASSPQHCLSCRKLCEKLVPVWGRVGRPPVQEILTTWSIRPSVWLTVILRSANRP